MELKPYPYAEWMMNVRKSRAGIRVIATGRQCRKTSFLICYLLETLERVPGAHVILIAPTWPMVERVVRPMIRERMEDRGLEARRSSAEYTTIGLGVFHHVSVAANTEGSAFEVGAVDEADYNVLEPVGLAVHAKLLIVAGTPRARRKQDARSWFERWYKQGRPGKERVKTWKAWRVSSGEFIPAKVLAYWRKRLPPHMFKAEFEGRFVTYTEKEAKKRG